ncbi:MAG: crossover junction endodeoxyribonuclease RuvC [Firmicutes bacterium]|nr:crossover junction endodeoxyribonuclease RuvC [Bacillota bacterium]
MIILGIDPGYATLGFGVIKKETNSLVPIEYGVVTTPKDESLPVRLAMIDEKITKLLAKHKPDAVALEELFFAKNVKTGIQVAQARGVVAVCAIKACGNLFEYTPLQVKQALTGNGRADKHQIQFMTKAILGLECIPRPDDAADALAVAICHANTNDYSKRYF